MIDQFQAPIPGQSLTTAPGSMPFERPPEITDPEEAIQMHLTRLNEPEMTEDILDMLELDVDIRTLTEGILRSAVAEGIHSIDVSLVVAPVLHEFIRLTADREGIDYEEGLVDKEQESQKKKAVSIAKAEKYLRKFSSEKPEEKPMETTAKEPMESSEEIEPQGFMKRRTV